MKYIICLISYIVLICNAHAQSPKTANDSLSYALGQDLASYIIRMDLPVNKDLIIRAISDVLKEKPVLFQDEQKDEILRLGMQRIQKEQQDALKKKAMEFLDQNKKKPGVKISPEGLQYIVLKEGSGSKPNLNDSVVVHYIGTLADGKEFDNSYNRSQPLTLNLHSVIEAWKIGLPLMQKGAKYKFFVPYNLGYGERGSGSIPPFSTLIFEIELLDIKYAESDAV